MRKILCLVLAICMAIGGVAAMADVRTPARQSQEALQRAFTRHLEAFMNGIDLDREALRLDVSAMDDALVMGTAQRTDGVRGCRSIRRPRTCMSTDRPISWALTSWRASCRRWRAP